MTRAIDITTPLDKDVLLFHKMRVKEELSRLSECELHLLSNDQAINLDEVLGKTVTVTVERPDDTLRYFNGYVTRISQVGTHGRYHSYHATVRPWLWFLTRTTNCRIFQKKTVPDIIQEIFGHHSGIVDVKFELTEAYGEWEYCVQYRESDFEFVSRLMEHEGIYYFFKHVEGRRHTLVLADSYSAHSAAVDEDISFVPPGRAVRADKEHISEWSISRELQPGKYALTDYDFERPSVDLQVKSHIKREHALAEYEVYDYPGDYLMRNDGETYARTRIEELQAKHERVQGATNSRNIATGFLFKLVEHPRADQNTEYLVVSTELELQSSEYEAVDATAAPAAVYKCAFTALNSKQPFRAERLTRKPMVRGSQTAIVVGPAGETIYTDKYGRVKVHFHWDRHDRRDENSSCWIRVSQPWAGKGWGSVATPRIGQEVIVDFLEGDPDQPIITGRVYNAECQPPFGFPAGAVISGVKSDTHKGSGYNEMSLDDTAGKEKITIHGQYDMNTTVENDQTTTVHNCRTDMVDVDDSETIGVNQTLHVGSNRTETVGADETITIGGSRTESVGGMQSTSIAIAETHTVGAGRMHNVGAAEAISVGGAQMVNVGAVQSVNVGGAQIVKVGGAQSVSVGGAQSFGVGGPHSLSAAAVGQRAKGVFQVKAGSTALIEAPKIVLKAGGSRITLDSGGVTIKGAKIMVQGDGNVTVKAGGSIKIKGSNIGEN